MVDIPFKNFHEVVVKEILKVLNDRHKVSDKFIEFHPMDYDHSCPKVTIMWYGDKI